jgi:hypothetical protein
MARADGMAARRPGVGRSVEAFLARAATRLARPVLEAVVAGKLRSAEEHRTGWTDTERRGGTLIEFGAHADEALDNWFGNSDPVEHMQRPRFLH